MATQSNVNITALATPWWIPNGAFTEVIKKKGTVVSSGAPLVVIKNKTLGGTVSGEQVNEVVGMKTYEYTNHLGNVLLTTNDKRLPIDNDADNFIEAYQADVVSYSDYYPYGMAMVGRNSNISDYRFGMNGMEMDNESKGNGNSYTTYFRQYDPRLGRWLSKDPVLHPWQSPYVAFDNNPIYFADPSGAEGEGAVSGGGGELTGKPATPDAPGVNGEIGGDMMSGYELHEIKIVAEAPTLSSTESLFGKLEALSAVIDAALRGSSDMQMGIEMKGEGQGDPKDLHHVNRKNLDQVWFTITEEEFETLTMLLDVTSKASDAMDGNSPYRLTKKTKEYKSETLSYRQYHRSQGEKYSGRKHPGSGGYNSALGSDHKEYQAKFGGTYSEQVVEVVIQKANAEEILTAIYEVQKAIHKNLNEGKGYNNQQNNVPVEYKIYGESIQMFDTMRSEDPKDTIPFSGKSGYHIKTN